MRIGNQHNFSPLTSVKSGLSKAILSIAKRLRSIVKMFRSHVDNTKGAPIKNPSAKHPETPETTKAAQQGRRHLKTEATLVTSARQHVEKTKQVAENLETHLHNTGKKLDADHSEQFGKIKPKVVQDHLDNQKSFTRKQSGDIEINGGKIRNNKGEVVSYTYKGMNIPPHLLHNE